MQSLARGAARGSLLRDICHVVDEIDKQTLCTLVCGNIVVVSLAVQFPIVAVIFCCSSCHRADKMTSVAQRLILIAIDGSDNSEKAFQCMVYYFRPCHCCDD